MLLLNKLLPELVLPLGVSLMLIVVGLKRQRRGPLVAAVVLLLLASNPLLARGLMRVVEHHAVRGAAADAPVADAIVVLSAGRVIAPGEARVSEWRDADRFFGGLELWRAGRAPLLVFTRPPIAGQREGESEGELLAALARELGVPAERIGLTGEVLNTADEARGVAALLQSDATPRPRVLLVTSAFHMGRARQQFEAVGFAVSPFPVDFWAQARQGWSVLDFVPSVSALGTTHTALRELYGRFFYFLRG